MLRQKRVWRSLVYVALATFATVALAGCGSSSSSPAVPPVTPTVSGTVTDTSVSGTPAEHAVVADANVVLVAAGDVEAIDSIQPMEDAANAVLTALAATPPTATTGYATTSAADGTYSFTGVTDGKYFLVVLPTDADHLPGGFRESGMVTGGTIPAGGGDVELSMVQSAAATYVGPSTCLNCHPKANIKHTLHFVGMRKLDSAGVMMPNGLMDMASVVPVDLTANNNAGLADFPASGDPAVEIQLNGSAATTVFLGHDATGLYFQIGAITAPMYRIWGTYGGEKGVWKMRFVTIIGDDGLPAASWGAGNTNGFGYFEMSPIQFQEQYTDGTNGVTAKYANYHGERWDFAGTATVAGQFIDASGGAIADFVRAKSWDTNCAVCHGGTQITTDANGNRVINFAPDANGYALDAAGTGTKYDINVGCEKCHGPGSEHVAVGGKGHLIVQPELLTAGRLTQICGSCHIRGDNHTDLGGEPSLFSSETPGSQTTFDSFRPGMSPAAYFGTTDGSGIAPFENTTDPTAKLTFESAAGSAGYMDPINYGGTGNSASWQDISYQLDFPFVTTTTSGDRTQVTGSFNHTKGHHQQFLDLVRTKMYKNDNELVTCIDCHDTHGTDLEAQLTMSNDNNAVCLQCHNSDLRAPGTSEDKHPSNFQTITPAMVDALVATGTVDPAIGTAVMAHVGTWATTSMTGYDPEGTGMGRCSLCHMAKTSKSASFVNALTVGANQYLEADDHSHLFDVTTTEAVNAMEVDKGAAGTTPAGMTNSCGFCHVSALN